MGISKPLPCEFPGCEKSEQIRSKVKDQESEHFGLYVCKYHANLLRKKTRSDKTRRTQEARKEQRKDYPEFFQKMCEIARVSVCEECGTRLRGDSTEVAHIVKKTSDGGNPEVGTESDNIIFLCGVYSENQCHAKFDSSLVVREKMKVFPLILEKFILFQDKIKNWNTSEVRHCVKNLP